MSPKPIVGYFDFRGRAEPIRLLLKYVGVDFEDKRYSFDMATRKSEWFDVKPTLGLDFPTVPYYMEGDLKMTQTIAILRYLARKHSLEGSNETIKIRASIVEQQILDMATAYAGVFYRRGKPEATADEKAAYVKELHEKLELLNRFIGENRFAAGNEFTYVDTWVYECLHMFDTNESAKGCLAKHANLARYAATIEALPQFADYLKKLNSA